MQNHGMKWSAIKLTARMLRSEDAAAYVGGEQVLKDLEASGWIAPLKAVQKDDAVGCETARCSLRPPDLRDSIGMG